MIKRIWATFFARTLEFVRDRSTLGWNFILPVALVFGLAFVFSGGGQPLFKVGVVADHLNAAAQPDTNLHPFLQTQHVDFYTVPVDAVDAAVRKVGRHQADMLLDLRAGQMHYWVNDDSQKGYFLAKLLAASDGSKLTQQSVRGEEIRYIDWVVPGILGMNLMFSCLFGVGFVIVRYRKSGYLKRLNATPLNAAEFLLAQIFSRLLLVMCVTSMVFIGTNLFMHFTMEGSYLNLLLVLFVGAFCLISLSLLVAARVSSEELAGGLLNLLTWPMMVLSGVWFSMEGTNPVMQWLSQLSPLTHMLTAARAIMLDGAGLADITPQLLTLAGMAVVFLLVGAATFKWTTD
ncbi:ABC transporter permease [Candidatus Thiothrix sp. Deng01]|uniref:Transport permease protein n=1 Tax=Candidatus Thiothrix phosphatis TaxID=3112415 RepID=A0ABU6D0P0_9GAMM|nr:ABC transporter permease [Candidatus Thiothrix sp. Deng01]MEB4592630.1 ABC transporter permease [Candidatus Thiothrix sp. Deng01]